MALKKQVFEAGKAPRLVDMTPGEESAFLAEQTAAAADQAKAKKPTIAEVIDALLEREAGNNAPILAVKQKYQDWKAGGG